MNENRSNIPKFQIFHLTVKNNRLKNMTDLQFLKISKKKQILTNANYLFTWWRRPRISNCVYSFWNLHLNSYLKTTTVCVSNEIVLAHSFIFLNAKINKWFAIVTHGCVKNIEKCLEFFFILNLMRKHWDCVKIVIIFQITSYILFLFLLYTYKYEKNIFLAHLMS